MMRSLLALTLLAAAMLPAIALEGELPRDEPKWEFDFRQCHVRTLLRTLAKVGAMKKARLLLWI
jgi:hypothetical protein